MEEIEEDVQNILSAKIGDVNASLSRPSFASQKVDELFNLAITWVPHISSQRCSIIPATSAFFSRGNVVLPGILSQAETDCSWMVIDFLSKLGAPVKLWSHCCPSISSDWQGHSDVTALTKTLTIFKVQYNKMNDHYLLAQKEGDAHAQVFIGNGITAALEDYAMAAAVEAAIPTRLQIGTGLRASMYQTKQFDFKEYAAQSMRSSAAFNQVL